MAHKITVKGGGKLAAYLKGLERKAEAAHTVKVGFMSGAKYPDGTPVAMVAAIHNYGAPSQGIPARPFFSNMVAEKSPDWGPNIGNLLKRTNFNARQSLALMGEKISGDLRESIIHGHWAPLSDATRKTSAKGGFKAALIDTGHMLNSVTYQVDDGEQAQ